jgi:hypothetical protein
MRRHRVAQALRGFPGAQRHVHVFISLVDNRNDATARPADPDPGY